ncbi:MAG: hypothetical protein GY906_08535 [bacterium]|nr:hypothetical protein [bacterium]
MKRQALLVGVVIALLALCSNVMAIELEEVLATHHETIGGEEAWLDVQTVSMSGTMRMGGGQMEAPFSIEFKRPMKVRLEFTVQGMTGIQAYDGETGWSVMPFMGKTDPEEMAEDQLKEIKEQAEFDGLLINYEEKGHTVELVGEEEIEGTPAYKLKVTKENGDVVFTYLDTDYCLEFMNVTKREVQGNEVEITNAIGDYKEVEGLIFAHSIEVAFGDQPAAQEIIIDKIELGKEISDDRFTMPEPAPKVEEEATETEG